MTRAPWLIAPWLAACAFCLACTDQAASPGGPKGGATDGTFATLPDAAAASDRDATDALQPASSSPCSDLCVRVEAAACPSQKPCPATCQAASEEPTCGRQYVLWATCASRQPAALFACDRRDQAALDASQCAEELKNFGDCLLGAI